MLLSANQSLLALKSLTITSLRGRYHWAIVVGKDGAVPPCLVGSGRIRVGYSWTSAIAYTDYSHLWTGTLDPWSSLAHHIKTPALSI